jgi:hypothetical protein
LIVRFKFFRTLMGPKDLETDWNWIIGIGKQKTGDRRQKTE